MNSSLALAAAPDTRQHPLQTLFEAAADAMLVVAQDGRILAANRAAASLFGYDPAALSRLRVEDLMPERYRAAHGALRARYAQQPRVRAMGGAEDLHGVRRDGAEFPVEVSLGPLDGGQVLVTVADVTERRRTGEALREREEQLRLFIENVPVALAMFDDKMAYLAASRRWLNDYGLDGQAVIGRSLYDVFPDIPARWREAHRRALQGMVERNERERFERADGTTHWLRWEVRPWHAASGAVGGIVIFTEDITEQTRARGEVEEAEARFRATFEQAAVGIAHTSPDGRWLRVNRRLCEIVGYSREELLQRSFQDITYPDDLTLDLEQLRRLLGGAIDHYAMDKRYVRKDGGIVWIRLTVSLKRRADGLPDYTIVVIEDIDERKQAEQAVRRLRADMEELLAVQVAIGTAAAIAHELNQPLTAVASYADAARRLLQLGNPKPERLDHALQESAEQARRAGRVVRELLAFLHRREVSTEAVDLNTIVRESLAMVEASGLGGVNLAVHLAPDLRPVQANRLQIEKVLVNLVRNAEEAMRSHGIDKQSITITISTAAERDMALVTVQDNGPGVDAALARRIFDPFFSTKGTGIGMGLAISRALLEAHGGRLWLAEPGAGGATFHFTVPFAR